MRVKVFLTNLFDEAPKLKDRNLLPVGILSGKRTLYATMLKDNLAIISEEDRLPCFSWSIPVVETRFEPLSIPTWDTFKRIFSFCFGSLSLLDVFHQELVLLLLLKSSLL